jgi:hypothetical protein
VTVRSLHGWATSAMLCVAAAALAVLLAAFVPLVEVWAAYRVARTGGTGPYAIVLVTESGVWAAVVLAHLAAGVCALVWLRRAYANLRALPGARPKYQPGLAVAAWFIPFANLVLPALVVADLAGYAGRRVRWLVWAWWAAYVAAGVAWWVGFLSADRHAVADVAAGLRSGTAGDPGVASHVLAHLVAGRLPWAVLSLAAAVLFLAVVDRVTAAQYASFDALRRPAGPPPFIPVQVVREVPVRPATPVGRPGATIGP